MRQLMVAALAMALLAPACAGAPTPDPIVRHVSARIADSSSGFGLRLFDKLLGEPQAGNVVISPLSAALVLAMAASGAQGETRAAILKTLGVDPASDPAPEVAATIQRLAGADGNAELELAQAVWVQKGLKLDPVYVKALHDQYRAHLATIDFQSPDAPKAVNSWVSDATHHKIPVLVDTFDPGVVGYLANAIYFHALWRIEFDAAATGDFHTFGGQTSRVARMRRSDNVTQLTTPDYVAALLPYKGGRFSALIVLPREPMTPAALSRFLTAATWSQVLGYLHQATGTSLGGECRLPDNAIAPDAGVGCDGTLEMPKFEIDYQKDLTATLRAIGMPIPGALPAFCGGCALGQVVEKTYLQVDEKGTTAAAATGGSVVTSARLPMIVDHPFVFSLIDNATDAPLFLGAIGDL